MDHEVKIELPPNTMLVKVANPTDESGPCAMINKDDFDPETQEEYVPPRPSKDEKAAAKTKK